MQHWAHKTQDEDKKTKKTQKIEQMNNKEPTKKIGVNPGACEG
jgi:membrane protein insertase Oxa1/YidC/SpoIIIJ